MRKQIAVFTAAISILLVTASLAQTIRSQSNAGIISRRAISECRIEGDFSICTDAETGAVTTGPALNPSMKEKEVTLTIPDYEAGDEARYFYYVARIRDTSTGGGTPDYVENGIVHETTMVQLDESGREENWQYYLAVTDSLSGETRITADLLDLRLPILARSIEMVVQQAWRTVNRIPMEEYARLRRGAIRTSLEYKELRTGLVVEDMPVEDVLYQLGRNTGCDIRLDDVAVIIESCP